MNEKQSSKPQQTTLIQWIEFVLPWGVQLASAALDFLLLRFLLGLADFRTQDDCSFEIEMELSIG